MSASARAVGARRRPASRCRSRSAARRRCRCMRRPSGTADAGSDYRAKSETLTFAPGQRHKWFAVKVIGDRHPEPTRPSRSRCSRRSTRWWTTPRRPARSSTTTRARRPAPRLPTRRGAAADEARAEGLPDRAIFRPHDHGRRHRGPASGRDVRASCRERRSSTTPRRSVAPNAAYEAYRARGDQGRPTLRPPAERLPGDRAADEKITSRIWTQARPPRARRTARPPVCLCCGTPSSTRALRAVLPSRSSGRCGAVRVRSRGFPLYSTHLHKFEPVFSAIRASRSSECAARLGRRSVPCTIERRRRVPISVTAPVFDQRRRALRWPLRHRTLARLRDHASAPCATPTRATCTGTPVAAGGGVTPANALDVAHQEFERIVNLMLLTVDLLQDVHDDGSAPTSRPSARPRRGCWATHWIGTLTRSSSSGRSSGRTDGGAARDALALWRTARRVAAQATPQPGGSATPGRAPAPRPMDRLGRAVRPPRTTGRNEPR